MDQKVLNYKRNQAWFKDNYRAKPYREKIGMLNSDIFSVLAEYSKKKDFIELNFRDGNGKEKFKLTIIGVNNKGKFNYHICKINKVSRPRSKLKRIEILNSSLKFSGQWKPSGFDNMIHIKLSRNEEKDEEKDEEKAYIAKLIIRTYKKYYTSKDPSKFWIKDKTDEYYIFRRSSEEV